MSKKIYTIIISLILLSFMVMAFPRIQEPHTRFNPWLDACVYFFLDGQCYVDPDYCSTVYGKNIMITLDKDDECIYSLIEYYAFLEEEKGIIVDDELVEQAIGAEEDYDVKLSDLGEFMIVETEKITLEAIVEDPDGENVEITYNEPLDDNGTWETTYGDAGK